MQNYFPDLIGQEIVKKKLSFYIDAFNTTSQAPFLLMAGAKGLGKTEFAKAFAKNLYNEDGDKRSFIEINCSTIKNNEQFFEQIFLPLISDNEITVLFDECHALPQDLTMAFLTIFNAESNSRKTFEWDGMSFVFNFKQQPKMAPLFNCHELAQIVQLCLPEIIFSDEECLLKIASTIRNNARSAVKRSKEIMLYCGKNNSNIFTSKDFDILCDQIGILPYGLTYTEKQILQALNHCGSATLTGLAAKIGLSKTALQRDHELYLLNKNLMEIDGKRKITSKGIDVCKEL